MGASHAAISKNKIKKEESKKKKMKKIKEKDCISCFKLPKNELYDIIIRDGIYLYFILISYLQI